MNGAPELCYLDAVQVRTRFADRSLSPVELVSSLVARIEAVEPKVNALTHTFFDRALDQARRPKGGTQGVERAQGHSKACRSSSRTSTT